MKKMSVNINWKQQGSHKCHLIVAKVRTVRCDEGSDAWPSAPGPAQRQRTPGKSVPDTLHISQLLYLNGKM